MHRFVVWIERSTGSRQTRPDQSYPSRARSVRTLCEHTFVRWEQQRVEREAGARLPGYRDVTIRHFDAPEAVDTRFYEVEAKSILNRVPAASQMPFRWTINPYRGCTHACTYCAWGRSEERRCRERV